LDVRCSPFSILLSPFFFPSSLPLALSSFTRAIRGGNGLPFHFMNTPDEGAILERALKLPAKERALYLDAACGGDEALRERILQKVAKELDRTGAPPDPPGNDLQSTLVITPLDLGERPGDRLGRYQLLEKLGEGGMGSVWLAEQIEGVRRKVAVKVIKPGMDTKEVIARFEAERQALALMTHPDIAKVFDAGATDKGRPFFVMEFVAGIRITDYCDKHNLPTRERLALFVQVCQAVEHAHQKGIVHRDIKPANILVTLDEGVPSPKIIDFGIAKAIAGQHLTDKTLHTSFEQLIGTPIYMSPEQAEMEPLGIDARADIYSLGVLLYELLTGCTPVDAQKLKQLGPDQIRKLIREEEPLRPSRRLTTLSAAERATVAKHHQCQPPKLIDLVRNDLDWVVMKCLEKDRTRRYASALDLARDVQNYLDQRPVTARPPGWWYLFGKLVRRRRQSFAFSAARALLALLTVGLLLLLLPHHPPTPLSAEAQWDRTLDWLAHYDCSNNLAAALSYFLQTTNSSHEVLAKRAWANWLLYRDQDSDSALSDAESFATQAWKLNTNNYEAHLVLGLVAKTRGDWVQATNHLLTAEQLSHSANGQILISLASTLLAMGNLVDATNYAQMAENQPTNSWSVWMSLGRFRNQTGDSARARKAFDQAIKLAPQSPLAHRYFGQFLVRQNDAQSRARARQEFDKALQLNRTPSNLFAVGQAYAAAANFNEAVRYGKEAVEADSGKYIYHIGLAEVRLRLPDQGAEAMELFRQAQHQIEDMLGTSTDSSGQKPLLAAWRGVCQAGLGQTDAARSDFEFARPYAATDERVRDALIQGYALLRDHKAVEELKRLRPAVPP
jgi:serine/threonine protein kinase